jgi:cellulose synthase/poly-beta-1,6-N-acetylglucosamine synthase-like glycosyltransferase
LELLVYLAIVPLVLLSIASVAYSIIYFINLNTHYGEIEAQVTLIMAMTGPSQSFEIFLLKLNNQLLKPSRLIIGIESKQDPAYQKVLDLKARADFPVEIAIAGFATQSSQKCHNLISAFDILKTQQDYPEYVVLCDADISPPNWWLSALVKPLVNKTADIVSGYRWQQAKTNDFWENLTVFLDRKIALLPRPHAAEIVWGGSIAMTREVFKDVLQSGILTKTLSDDLSIGTYVYSKKYRVLNRRVLLVPSDAPKGLKAVWGFGVRQYQIMKIYRPKLWILSFFGAFFRFVGWSAIFYSLSISINFISIIIFIYFCLIIYIFYEFKIANLLQFKESRCKLNYQIFLVIIKPIIDLLNFLIILNSVFLLSVRWGNFVYHVKDMLMVYVERKELS